jgi:hypothetical protein
MSFTNTCADNVRIAIGDLELLTHERTKDSFNKLKRAIVTRLEATADMLEGEFNILPKDPIEPPAPARPRRGRRTTAIPDRTNVVDFRARADAVFKK